MADVVLSARGLSKSYTLDGKTLQVVRGADLDVRQGELVVVRGRSGSGKSTFLHMLGLMDAPESGVILHRGRDLGHATPAERAEARLRGIGFVFQRCYLVPTLSAAQNVALPMKAAGLPADEREKRVRLLLEQVGLLERLDHMPHQLSGGQQQLTAVARSLANAPYLLLADEPTGELDPESGRRVMEMLGLAAREHGAAVVLVTHAPQSAPSPASHYELRDGRPQAVGA